jgi:hypothetical protein
LGGGINLYAFVGNDPVNGSDPSGMAGGTCGNFSTHQLTLLGKLGHVAIGAGAWAAFSSGWNILGIRFGELPPHVPVAFMGTFGTWHEYRDGDLTWNPGAPCHGIVDWLAYMVVPFWSWAGIWPFASNPTFSGEAREYLWAALSGDDSFHSLLDPDFFTTFKRFGIRPPFVLPETPIQNWAPPGWISF